MAGFHDSGYFNSDNVHYWRKSLRLVRQADFVVVRIGIGCDLVGIVHPDRNPLMACMCIDYQCTNRSIPILFQIYFKDDSAVFQEKE